MRNRAIAGGIVALLLLVGCSGKPDVHDDQALADMHFSDPIVVSTYVQLATVFGRADLDTVIGRNSYLALYWKAGYLAAVPNTDSADGWNFVVSNTPLVNSYITLNAATREIVSRTEGRSWEENGTKLYAEAITYRLRFDPRLQAVMPPEITSRTYTLRLQFENDPATGAWRLAGSDLNRQDAERALSEAGIPMLPGLLSAIDAAKARDDGMVADEIEQSLGLTTSPDGTMVYQRKNGIAFLRYPIFVKQGETFLQMQAECAGITKNGWSWHMATRPELDRLFVKRGGQWVFDSPRYAIWGSSVGDGTSIAANAWSNHQMNGPGYADGFPTAPRAAGYSYLAYSLGPGAVLTVSDHWPDDNSKTFEQVALTPGLVVLCAAPLH